MARKCTIKIYAGLKVFAFLSFQSKQTFDCLVKNFGDATPFSPGEQTKEGPAIIGHDWSPQTCPRQQTQLTDSATHRHTSRPFSTRCYTATTWPMGGCSVQTLRTGRFWNSACNWHFSRLPRPLVRINLELGDLRRPDGVLGVPIDLILQFNSQNACFLNRSQFL